MIRVVTVSGIVILAGFALQPSKSPLGFHFLNAQGGNRTPRRPHGLSY